MISLLERAGTLFFSALLVTLLAIGSSTGEPTFSFAATPGKLPKAVVPIHYSLDLQPDLDKLTIAGAEVVDIDVTEPTDRLVLNAVNLTIDTATIEGEIGRASRIVPDTAAETVTITFPRAIAIGPHKLRIGFSAHINRGQLSHRRRPRAHGLEPA
jgi:aminopeptidase N